MLEIHETKRHAIFERLAQAPAEGEPHVIIVLDHTGDATFTYRPGTEDEKAREMFKRGKAAGLAPFAVKPDGKGGTEAELIHEFDPREHPRVVFTGPLAGGLQ